MKQAMMSFQKMVSICGAVVVLPVALWAQAGAGAPPAGPGAEATVDPGEKSPTTPKDAAKAKVMGAVKKARVFFVEPKDGATVPQTFNVKMGVEGIKIRPAGEDVTDMTSGHHHLIVDSKPGAAGEVVPADEKHLHFGKGQTETTLTLPPGEHTLTLQFADGAHKSFGPALSQTIKVKVK